MGKFKSDGAEEKKQVQTLFEDLRHGYECRKKENLEKIQEKGRIRSNSNLEVILKVKTAQKLEIAKNQ